MKKPNMVLFSIKTPCLALFLAAVASPSFLSGQEYRWYKGNTHTHTLWSDGNDLPESVAHWYKENGYHFLVLSDHNILSRGERWKTLRADQAIQVVERSERLWGRGYLQTRIREGKKEVRLSPLSEVRDLVEERERFLMIEGIELTARAGGLAVHTNPMNVSALLEVKRDSARTVEEELAFHGRLVDEHSRLHGRPVFWQANHPNFRFSLTAEQLAMVDGLNGVEVMNSSSRCFNLGDKRRPSVERLWDLANTLRLKRRLGAPIFGTATDDTHDYYGENPVVNGPGTAWVMARSRELTPESITQAMLKGEFYATTGVLLETVRYDAEERSLLIVAAEEPGVNYEIEFIGSKKAVSLASETVEPVIDSDGVAHPVSRRYGDSRIGMALAKVKGRAAEYRFTGDELYVRAVVHSDKPPHFVYDDGTDYEQKAWTQPVGWR